jgi:hypothetical protein
MIDSEIIHLLSVRKFTVLSVCCSMNWIGLSSIGLDCTHFPVTDSSRSPDKIKKQLKAIKLLFQLVCVILTLTVYFWLKCILSGRYSGGVVWHDSIKGPAPFLSQVCFLLFNCHESLTAHEVTRTHLLLFIVIYPFRVPNHRTLR